MAVSSFVLNNASLALLMLLVSYSHCVATFSCYTSFLPSLYERHHLPPVVNTPDVQLEFQLDRPLRPVIERMKAISPIIYVEGSMAGEMSLKIDSDAVAIQTFYDKLIPRVDEESSQSQQEPAKCTLKVDSKKLLASLQWQSSMARGSVGSYIICLIRNEMMVVHVMLSPEEVGQVFVDSFALFSTYLTSCVHTSFLGSLQVLHLLHTSTLPFRRYV